MYGEKVSVYHSSDDIFEWLENILIVSRGFDFRTFNSALLLYIWKNKRLPDTSTRNEFDTLNHDL